MNAQRHGRRFIPKAVQAAPQKGSVQVERNALSSVCPIVPHGLTTPTPSAGSSTPLALRSGRDSQ